MSECSWAGGSGRVESKMVPSLLLSCELSVFVEEIPDRKKNLWYVQRQMQNFLCLCFLAIPASRFLVPKMRSNQFRCKHGISRIINRNLCLRWQWSPFIKESFIHSFWENSFNNILVASVCKLPWLKKTYFYPLIAEKLKIIILTDNPCSLLDLLSNVRLQNIQVAG